MFHTRLRRGEPLSGLVAICGFLLWRGVPCIAVEVPLADLQGGNRNSAVIVFDVGQGNCVLLSCPNGSKVVIDCGSSNPGGTTTMQTCPGIRIRQRNYSKM